MAQSTQVLPLVRELLMLEADEILAGDNQPEVQEERRLAVARWLYDQYRQRLAKELPKLLRELPTMSAVLRTETLTHQQPDPRQRELARLRGWAARQLARTRGVKGHGADAVRVFVYLSLRDVCEWERAHVEPAAVEVDRRTARVDHYDGFDSEAA